MRKELNSKGKIGSLLPALFFIISLLVGSLNQGCSPDPEAKAREMLIRAQVKWQQEKKDETKETLKKVIIEFPRTKAAAEAKGALGRLYTSEADDLLKDALMNKRLKKTEESKKVLNKIITEYPQSIAAGKARHLIEQVDVDYENDLFFDLEYKDYSVKEVSGSFVTTENGQIYIIRGKVIHNYAESRSSILLKGSLMDEETKVIQHRFNFAGNVIPEEQIIDMTIEELNNALENQFRKNIIDAKIRPYSPAPFMIIFEDLPDNWRGFRVVGVSSSPGEKKENSD
ncbi:DUF3426 domain-containing protein [Thermodesulfobacteriota bacterium]